MDFYKFKSQRMEINNLNNMKMTEQERRAIEEAADKQRNNSATCFCANSLRESIESYEDGKHDGFIAGAEFLAELSKPSEDMIQRIEEILNPQFENDVFTWCQIHKAISKLQPIEPVFCPDCGNRVRLSGNGVMEQLCTCHRWPTVILQSEPWPPEPKGTTTAGLSAQPKPSENISDFDLWIERNGYAFTPSGYVKGSAIESRGSLLNRYHAECQPSEKSGQLNVNITDHDLANMAEKWEEELLTDIGIKTAFVCGFKKCREIAKLLPSSPSGEKSGQVSTELTEALDYLQKFRQGYTLRDIDATQTDASKTLDALIQRMQNLQQTK
jgi:hypothetical protein